MVCVRTPLETTFMSEVTRILSVIEDGDPQAAAQLLPLVYDQLRELAARKMAVEKPGQTLQATALVHEAYVRLVDVKQTKCWESRGHFFAAPMNSTTTYLLDMEGRIVNRWQSEFRPPRKARFKRVVVLFGTSSAMTV